MPGIFIVTQKKELTKSLEFIKKWGGYASSVVCSDRPVTEILHLQYKKDVVKVG